MEGFEPLGSNPPVPSDLAFRQHRRELSKRSVTSPRSHAQDARFARSLPYAVPGGREAPIASPRWPGKAMGQASSASRRLVPVTERKSQEENVYRWHIKRESEGERLDITPDGGSAGREGRQFTVANVGNHGRIYLRWVNSNWSSNWASSPGRKADSFRPSIRPAHQRQPQPNFVFPVTPPSTAGLDALTTDQQQAETNEEEDSEMFGSHWESHSQSTKRGLGFSDIRPPARRRAHSDSTMRDATSIIGESDDGAFKIIISKPGDENRPKTMEDIDLERAAPFLDISIPSWRLGTPRFTSKGTPIIRGSSYAPTEEYRSSNMSMLNRSTRDGNLAPPELIMLPKRPSQLSIPVLQLPADAVDDHVMSPPPITSAKLPPPIRSTYLSTHLVIEPAMFDSLTFKPACDDRAIVRYSSNTGAVTAATPPRLVAEITSPSFLDYELISDFFLTYRAFLEPGDLIRMLFARFRWAVQRNDETGTVVRVRTFVALRHWVLNYFLDDFVVDYGLRVTCSNLLNDLIDDLSRDQRNRKVELKILSEMKKCWRRVCAQYWDGPEFDSSLGDNVPITPGGLPGDRNPSVEPSFGDNEDEMPPRLEMTLPPRDGIHETSFLIDVSKAGHFGHSVVADRPGTPENRQSNEHNHRQTSPTSILSIDVISCSFPGKSLRNGQTGAVPLGAHPVAAGSVYSSTGPVAMTPKALVGKRVRPAHKRNGSLTDSLREHSAAEKTAPKDAGEYMLPVPYAGSLVRGNLMPPGQAFVEVLPPSMAGESQRQTTVFQPQPELVAKEKTTASAMSGQGMRKLIGSVRRALSTKGQGISPTHGNFIDISPIGPRGATTNRLPGTAIVPQARPRQNGARPPVRIDLLGAEIAEDFKKAVREEAVSEGAKRGLTSNVFAAPHKPVPGEMLEYSTAHLDSSFDDLPRQSFLRPSSDMGFTAGSKSIVIVDDTAVNVPAMTGALPAVNPSVEAFADTFMPNGGDPTPPNTPPGQGLGTPRRSSYLLNQHIVRPSTDSDHLPQFAYDDGVSRHEGQQSHAISQLSMDFDESSRNHSRVLVSRGSGRIHRRHRSSRTNQSLSSIAQRRHASFHSGMAPRPTTETVRSFDATTHSDGSVVDEVDADIAPQPLRLLRRRPAGDLRAAAAGEIDGLPLRRSRSVGSLTTYTDSLRSSYLQHHDSRGFVEVVSSDYSQEHADTFSLGAMAQSSTKRPLSLFSTHSSKPIMRPSFEAEAQKLAQIPDDEEDDGGIESALLKLEGKYEKRGFKLSMEPQGVPLVFDDVDTIGLAIGDPEAAQNEKKGHRHLHVGVGDAHDQHRQSGVPEPSSDVHGSFLGAPQRANTEATSFLSTRDSYSSIPLLERGLTDDGQSKTATREWTNMSVLQASDEEDAGGTERADGQSQQSAFEVVEKTDSLRQIKPGETMPAGDEQSFLEDESDDESALSSELSAEVHSDELMSSPARQGIIVSKPWGAPTHPPPRTSPPSPPITLAQALRLSPEAANIPQLHEHQLWLQKPLPPTPDTTPTVPYRPESPRDPTGTTEALRGAPKTIDPELTRKFSVHLPFILAFDSEILAQQFTLIEKDALNEIDWKELIDMEWKNATNNDSRSWVQFLRNTDARGVEVVIARFNIMVKWAISEIVLTQDIEERARCIIKYIHIANHCRRYRNFATMGQITIALSSNEVGRLSKTWRLLPPQDMKAFKELEQLVSPTRNFYSLRAEMEGGTDSGCIPFVGIYTHDLLFNAQRPSEIASSPTTAPLVNFERCRCSAAVVKTLLRLLEASTLYQFQPIEGITERCLWMSALSDEEIRRHSESLQ